MQPEELSYAIITPYSMRKSRTGGIVGRLISRTGLDLVGGRMFAPSAELTKRYAETIVTEADARHRATQELLRDYVLKNFTGKVNGQRPRARQFGTHLATTSRTTQEKQPTLSPEFLRISIQKELSAI